MTKICLVTSEFFPFTSGGIGVLLHNLVKEYSSLDVSFHILSTGDWQIDDSAFRLVFPNARLWQVKDLLVENEHPAIHPPQWAFTTHPWHHKSHQVAQALGRLAAQGELFDFVEFPDWGGLAFCSTQNKLLGDWQHGDISVRLHSTDSILRPGQPTAGGAATALIHDLERKALEDADIIVAHLSTIASATQRHFGFDSRWTEKVHIDAPPISLPIERNSVQFHEQTPICFPSKIQFLKRPEVFLNGALAFLNATPDYQGSIIFAAHATDGKLRDTIKSRIPPHLAARVSITDQMTPAMRETILKQGLSVFPSPFESFCLTAYEVSALGGWAILNSDNPAFSEQTAWKDGVNCLKFDGTALSLANRLSQAWNEREISHIQPIRHKPTRKPYWLTHRRQSQGKVGKNETIPLVSVIVPYFNMGRYIIRTLESILSSTYSNVEIIIVDDCSNDEHSKIVLDKIENSEKFDRLKILRSPANIGLPAVRNFGIKSAKGKYILTLDSDDLIREDFIELAVKSLEKNPDFTFVVPQTAFISDDSSPASLNVIDYAMFVGSAFCGGTFVNRFSTATSLGRREVYEEFPYDENMNSYEDWDFYSRANLAGKRFVVTSDIYFYYRRRQDSMIAGNNTEKHNRNISFIRSKQRMQFGTACLDMTVMSDIEAYNNTLVRNSTQSSAAPPERSNEYENYIRKLRTHIAHQEEMLKDISTSFENFKSSMKMDIESDPPREAQFFNFRFLKKIKEGWKLRKSIKDLRNKGFDAEWYLKQYPDVAQANVNPAKHFILHGQFEGRSPNSKGVL